MPTVHGYNSSVAAGTETIWAAAAGVWVPPTVAQIHNLTSDSANDDVAGSGALTVLVEGYGASGNALSEIVTMTGAVDAPTTGLYTHIHTMRVLTTGATGTNEGLILAEADTDTTDICAIPVGANVSNGAILYAGNYGQQLHVRGASISASGLTDGATSIEVRLAHKQAGALLTLTTIACIWSGAGSVVTVPLDLVLTYGDWIRLDATSSDAAAKVAATINYASLGA